MDFDEKLITFIKEEYVDEIAINKELNHVENTIKSYFQSLEGKLKEEISISDGKIKLEYDLEDNKIVQFTIDDCYLYFIKKDKVIEVIISTCDRNPYDIFKAKKKMQYLHKYDYVANNDYMINEGLFNSYIEKTFKNIIK